MISVEDRDMNFLVFLQAESAVRRGIVGCCKSCGVESAIGH